MDFERPQERLLECGINNTHSIYLVKHLGSLRDYSVCAEMHNIKDFFEN